MRNTQTKSESKISFKKLRKRDKKEIAHWFNTYADPVYGFIYYRVGRDADMAGEAAQETFVTALERIEKYDPERGEMFPWLTYIARNCIRKVLRRKGNAHELADFWEEVDHNLVKAVGDMDSNMVPEELLLQKETAELVRMAIANLPLRYQMALRRKYFEDLSLHEMAILEKSSEGAMKVLLHRARNAFRNAFETVAARFFERKSEGRIIP